MTQRNLVERLYGTLILMILAQLWSSLVTAAKHSTQENRIYWFDAKHAYFTVVLGWIWLVLYLQARDNTSVLQENGGPLCWQVSVMFGNFKSGWLFFLSQLLLWFLWLWQYTSAHFFLNALGCINYCCCISIFIGPSSILNGSPSSALLALAFPLSFSRNGSSWVTYMGSQQLHWVFHKGALIFPFILSWNIKKLWMWYFFQIKFD